VTVVCVRAAWLTWQGNTVPLEDESAGYFCSALDLGAPTVREVIDNLPDADGAIDRTQFMGPRAVSADITALAGAGAVIDDVARMFGPFMLPSARPVLHYVLDVGTPAGLEHTLTVRPASYDWQLIGDQQRDVHLAWVAADPIARDPTVRQAIAWAGSATIPGRTYPLTFDRVYPGTGGSPNTATLHSPGDVPIQPTLRIWGPIGGPVVVFSPPAGPTFRVAFLSTFMVASGSYVDVDTRQHTAYYNGDPAQNMLTAIDWSANAWPLLAPNTDWGMTISGTSTTGVSQVVATWQDGYLS
jgi:hypothetical protein